MVFIKRKAWLVEIALLSFFNWHWLNVYYYIAWLFTRVAYESYNEVGYY